MRAVNISKELWGEDAFVFDPERWMKPNQANSGGGVTNFSFMTFLHGKSLHKQFMFVLSGY